MASITKNELKNGGVSYRIQAVTTLLSGKQKSYASTWRKPEGMTEAQAKKEAQKYAFEFEEKIKRLSGGAIDDRNIRFAEYSKRWIEQSRDSNSLSHAVRSEEILEEVNTVLGSYMLNDLTPSVIQRYLNSLKKRKRKRVRAKATGLSVYASERVIV